MARPRKNTPADLFTSTEVAVGSGLPARSFKFLQTEDLAPAAASFVASGGKMETRFWNIRGIQQGALIGAFEKSGVGLLTAARLAKELAAEFGARYGELPSNLVSYVQPPLNPKHPYSPWEDIPGEPWRDIRNDFWLHWHLRERTGIYRPGKALRNDFIVEIVDREYVLVCVHDVKIDYLEPMYRIVGLGRGEDAKVIGISDEVNMNFSDPAAQEKYQQIETEYLTAHKNAVATVRVNISLAIRNALDAIHDHRKRTNASLDWNTSTNLNPHYQEVGPDGWPVGGDDE